MAKIKRDIGIFDQGALTREHEDYIAVEEPLEIRLAYQKDGKEVDETFSITMRSPGADRELALGLLYSEGIIANRKDVVEIRSGHVLSNRVEIMLKSDQWLRDRHWERHTMTNSSCGVCGKSTLDFLGERGVYLHRKGQPSFTAENIYSVLNQLDKKQTNFHFTGGVHAAILFDLNGDIVDLQEDVGRHNAMDKIVGRAVMEDRLPLNECGILFSGRCSFELIQKAHMAGISLVFSVGAPTSLAVELAEETGITLAGFIKRRKFNVYNDQSRLQHG